MSFFRSFFSTRKPSRHQWSEEEYTGRGVVLGYRECVECGRKETKLHNYATGEDEWVCGQFLDHQEVETVFVFAGVCPPFRRRRAKP
jgi:hypothetical protein